MTVGPSSPAPSLTICRGGTTNPHLDPESRDSRRDRSRSRRGPWADGLPGPETGAWGEGPRAGRPHRRGGYGPDDWARRGPGLDPYDRLGGPLGRGRGGRRRKGDVRVAVLQLLAEEPRNGYQLISALEERTEGAWRPSPGTIYPALAQLTDEGLIEPVEEGGKVYRLTAAGREAEEVGSDTPRTWDEIRDASAPRHPRADHALWHEFGQLAQALKAVTGAGTARDHERAAALLAETRRKVYGLLAEGGDTPASTED